jgi:hypothetical protein
MGWGARHQVYGYYDITLKLLAPIVVAKATGLAPILIDALRAVARAIPL